MTDRVNQEAARQTRRSAVRAAGLAALLVLVASGCSGPELAAPPMTRAPSAPRASGVPVIGPARYTVPTPVSWVERTPEGVDRLVVNGRRMEVRGRETVALGPEEPEVEAGFAAPAWAPAPLRYVFWKDKELYGAQTFRGELTRIETLPTDVVRAFDWLDGIGIATATGTFLVRAGAAGSADARLARLGVSGVSQAVAVDAQRAMALTVFGHALLTIDAGKTYRDLTADLGEGTGLEVRGDELAVTLFGGRERFIGPSGAVSDARLTPGPRRGEPPPDYDDRWPEDAHSTALESVVSAGLPLADGTAVAVAQGTFGRVDLASGRALSVDQVTEKGADCAPIRAPDGLLLVCSSPERAVVVDVTATTRIERSFDLTGAPPYDRFVGTDGEGLGFVGSCDGGAIAPEPVDAISSASPYNTSAQRSPVFCVRASHDSWIEHRVDPADATDVYAWIPRPDGGAVAIVVRPGAFLREEERVSVRGPLRVIRLAREEPPLTIPRYARDEQQTLGRAMRVTADGVVEGWIATQGGPTGLVSISIDGEGHVRQHPGPSRANGIVHAGAFAMAQTDDGKLFETIDRGHRWLEVEPPPGSPSARPSSCTAVGCRVGTFVRVGWSSADEHPPTPPDTITSSLARELRERSSSRRYGPAPPVIRLGCSFAAPGEGQRMSESYGFGVTPAPAPRNMAPSRLGAQGVMYLPYSGPMVPQTGDAEIAWIPPLDLAAPIRRATIPLSRGGLAGATHRPYEVRLGYVIDGAGAIEPLPIAPKEACASALLEDAGVVRSLGGCHPDPTMGVNLGDRMLLIHSPNDAHVVSVIDVPSRDGEKRPLATAPRELHRTPVAPGSPRAHTFGAGLRAGAPVLVAIDGGGEALLTAIDPRRGTLGAEEPLAPLTAMTIGSDPRCTAPAADAEARVVVVFDSEIGLVRGALRGISASGTSSVAVIRWSRARACLEAVDLSVRDERYEPETGFYEQPGVVRKLIARFGPGSASASSRGKPAGPAPSGAGTLALIGYGSELRQKLRCDGIQR